MRRIFVLLLACMFVAGSASGAFAVVYGEPGYELEGYDEDSAWEIDSVETLIKMRDDINNGTVDTGKYYKLTADIDLTSYTDWEPIGFTDSYLEDDEDDDFTERSFKGHFDGNGHTITVNFVRTDKTLTGVFGYIEGGTVENLSVAGNIRVAALNKTGDYYAGAVTAAMYRGSAINNCKFDGTINMSSSQKGNFLFAGGIAGNVFDCYGNDETIRLTNNSVGSRDTSTVIKALQGFNNNGFTYAGGIVGGIGDNFDKTSAITGNYSRLKTVAGHTDTLTYGEKSDFAGTIANNTEINTADTPAPVPAVTAPVIATESLPSATAGKAYSAQLAATGDSPITWTVYSGFLPTGLTLSDTGAISGTPTTAGTYTFTVKASNSGGEATKTFTLTVVQVITAPVITTESLPSATAGKAYSAAITATGDNITWTVSGLPSGLTFDSGTISGTPAVSGIYTVTAAARNSAGADSKSFTLTVFDIAKPVVIDTDIKITTESLPDGKAGEAYSAGIETSGAKAGYNVVWLIIGLPEGMSYSNNGITAKLSGTPKTAGSFTVKVAVSDTQTEYSRDFTLKIADGDSDNEKIHNGHRYRIYPDGMTWSEAKAYCESLGGHLVTIASQEEQNVVASLVLSGDKNSYWLGGQKNDNDAWSWIDGSAWDYTHWA
ncbi:MAG: putative Ig domain-containing protein, partial [Synergistaceae bacterium]|nr:putative Ig domain-containing protein [Synergistaceae bacterium]